MSSTVRRAALAAAAGCLLLASCSSGDEGPADAARKPMPRSLCETGISTRALREMYPGPYTGLKMIPSTGGGISRVDGGKGRTEGDCDVWITQEKGDVFTVVKVFLAVHSDETAHDLYTRFRKWYPDSQPLTLGPAEGFTTYKETALAFDCKAPRQTGSGTRQLGASARVYLPRHPEGLDVDRSALAEGAARLAADTARYVSSTVLKCDGPSLPSGAPRQEPPEEP